MLTIQQKSELSKFKELINQSPVHTDFNNDGNYWFIPIADLEADINNVFDGFQFKILEIQELVNTITVRVRIEVLHPILSEWLSYDGTGTVVLPSGSIKGSMGFIQLGKEHEYVNLASAKAEQSAARKIGPRFGSNLNRDNTAEKRSLVVEYPPFDIYSIKTPLDISKALVSKQINSQYADELRYKLQRGELIEAPESIIANEDVAHALLNNDPIEVNTVSGTKRKYTKKN